MLSNLLIVLGAIVALWITFGIAIIIAAEKRNDPRVPLGVKVRFYAVATLTAPMIVLQHGVFPSAIGIIRADDDEGARD